MVDSPLEPILRQDRRLTLVALGLVLVLSWAYLLNGAGTGMSAVTMTRMPADMVMAPAVWTLAYATLMFFMWWIMMIAMMLPGAAPVVLLAAALNRRSRPDRPPYGSTGAFVGGYLGAWAGFSLVAVIVQWQLQKSGFLSGMLALNSSAIAGTLLIATAAWQLTPLKQACLRQCRSPIRFLTERHRPGNAGALRMGLEHGLYCLGCCWFLMALLFVGGVMNLFWIMGLTVYVLIEKVWPRGQALSRVAATVLAAAGVLLLFGGSA